MIAGIELIVTASVCFSLGFIFGVMWATREK